MLNEFLSYNIYFPFPKDNIKQSLTQSYLGGREEGSQTLRDFDAMLRSLDLISG